MRYNVKTFFTIVMKILITLAIIAGFYLSLIVIKNNKLESMPIPEEPKEIERVKYYIDSYHNVVTRVLKHSETLEGEGLVREVELSKLQKAELDVELLSDEIMLNSVAFYDVETFRLKTDKFLNILEILAKKEKVTTKDSNAAADWWNNLITLLDRYYTQDEKAEKLY